MNADTEDKPPSQPTTQNGKTPLELPKKVAVTYSEVKREYFPTEAQYLTEKDALHDAKIIVSYLEKMGIRTELYPGDALLPQKLRRDKPDIVMNLVGSVKGNEYLASTIPAVLELLGISYTGAGILGESLDYNKFLVKKISEFKSRQAMLLYAKQFTRTAKL